MTFAFPRDFTHGQHKNFVKHLAGRRAGVKVDWWGATKLTAVMTGSEAGCAIANRFFHSEGPVELVDRATRVGGSLRTPPDLLEREAAIGDFLRTTGPHFDFHTTNRPKSDEEVPLTPNAALRLEFGPRRSASCIVDAVPRTAAPLEHYGPKGSMPFNDRKRGAALLNEIQGHGRACDARRGDGPLRARPAAVRPDPVRARAGPARGEPASPRSLRLRKLRIMPADRVHGSFRASSSDRTAAHGTPELSAVATYDACCRAAGPSPNAIAVWPGRVIAAPKAVPPTCTW